MCVCLSLQLRQRTERRERLASKAERFDLRELRACRDERAERGKRERERVAYVVKRAQFRCVVLQTQRLKAARRDAVACAPGGRVSRSLPRRPSPDKSTTPRTVVQHLERVGAVIAQTHLDLRCPGVDRDLDQRFHGRRQVEHHLA